MRVQITARHCEVSDSLRERIEEVVGRLTKYDPRVSSAEVVLEEEKHGRKAEGILRVDRDEPVVASGEAPEFRAAVDQMADKLGKILRRRRSQVRDHKATPLAGEGPGV